MFMAKINIHFFEKKSSGMTRKEEHVIVKDFSPKKTYLVEF